MKDGVFAHWPNRITAVRFVGALVLFVVFALMGERPADGTFDVLGAAWPMRHLIHGCFWLFVVIAATDFLDGYLARRPLAQRDIDMLPTFLLIRGMAIIGWYLQRPEIALDSEFEGVKEWVISRAGGAATP